MKEGKCEREKVRLVLLQSAARPEQAFFAELLRFSSFRTLGPNEEWR